MLTSHWLLLLFCCNPFLHFKLSDVIGKDLPVSWWILETAVHNPTEAAIDETHQF